jgi:hypothetical protein
VRQLLLVPSWSRAAALAVLGASGCTILLGENKAYHEVDGTGGGATSATGAGGLTASSSAGASMDTAMASSSAASSGAVTSSSGAVSSTASTSGSSSSGLADGLGCGGASPGVCQSGFCVTGLCCDSACTGNCMTCDGADNGGQNGKCLNVIAGDDPFSNCTNQGKCDGHDKCSCVNGVKDLGEADVDCGGACPNKCGAKSTCSVSTDCSNNTCSQGYCCNQSCGGSSFPCYSCGIAGSEGNCIAVPTGLPGSCPTGQTCSTNHFCQ